MIGAAHADDTHHGFDQVVLRLLAPDFSRDRAKRSFFQGQFQTIVGVLFLTETVFVQAQFGVAAHHEPVAVAELELGIAFGTGTDGVLGIQVHTFLRRLDGVSGCHHDHFGADKHELGRARVDSCAGTARVQE